jgi:hypothetical protein
MTFRGKRLPEDAWWRPDEFTPDGREPKTALPSIPHLLTQKHLKRPAELPPDVRQALSAVREFSHPERQLLRESPLGRPSWAPTLARRGYLTIGPMGVRTLTPTGRWMKWCLEVLFDYQMGVPLRPAPADVVAFLADE